MVGMTATSCIFDDTAATTSPTSAAETDDSLTSDAASDTTEAVDAAPTTSTTASDTSTTTEPSSTETTPSSTATTTTTTTTTEPKPVPEGSGCTPGNGPLADGRWYGRVDAASADSLDFDLVCLFTDENASLAQVEDGESPLVIDDYYIRNSNPKIRIVPVVAGAPVRWYPDGDPSAETTVAYEQWYAAPNRYLGVWITVEGGRVTAINERWVP